MSLPRYPKYKDSGIEWLGQVPEHWGVKRLKRIATAFPSNVDKKSYDGEQVVRLCNYTDVYYNERIVDGMDFMVATASEDQISKFTLRAGDTIITKDSETADDIAIAAFVPADIEGVVCGYHLSVVRPFLGTCGAFVKRLFDSTYAKSNFAVLANGLTRVGLGQYELDNVELPVPPLPEQIAIASFLDRETAKIDGLIEEQRRLIELLKEKRQAVISHAVTKGLDPNLPLKDSGIDWLGMVPEHWDVAHLNRVVQSGRRITYGIVQPGERDENGRYMVRGQDYSFGWAKAETLFRVSDAVEIPYKRARLKAGDLVITIVGAGVGNIAVVPEWLDGANLTQTTARIAVEPAKADPRFVCAVLRSHIGRRSVEFYAKGAAQPGLNIEHVRVFPITLPPLPEQSAIASFLDAETAKLDTLTAEAERAIELLGERRSALISAAVTGQIDVRGIALQKAA
jgi:type I restriction enzyme S subunit